VKTSKEWAIIAAEAAGAFEALARAESIAGERARMKAYLSLAYQTAERMTDMEAHKMLLADLETIH